LLDNFSAVFPVSVEVTETGMLFTDYGATSPTHTFTYEKSSTIRGVTNLLEEAEASDKKFSVGDKFTMYNLGAIDGFKLYIG
jgi:hypothetical protein